MPVIVVDRSAPALKAARLVGLQTLRMEVLSTIGEEVIDLREFEHLIAATPDDAYNALVCTRFASELGRERVFQIAPEESNARHATSREWRGKIAVADDMTHQRLAQIMSDGAAFVVEPVAEGGMPREIAEASWSVAVLGTGGSFTICGPEQEVAPVEGDLLVRLYLPVLAPAPAPETGRWRRLTDRYRSSGRKRRALAQTSL